ncbi:hypothetical protein LNV09_14435 [Paucibacter sp. B2R-40]|uniref:hypothetical protein n=1 Tax=Paucibacter sp. B2R-40 TaxID=2893554 RepID=UPI0021E4D68E|nr:hypothetical protein [Paucibacter sp. B2R-40]MCV2355348.1 hypothetical protein [Paucibacter sp. B2R-40]
MSKKATQSSRVLRELLETAEDLFAHGVLSKPDLEQMKVLCEGSPLLASVPGCVIAQGTVDLEGLACETGISVEVLRTFAAISDPENAQLFTAASFLRRKVSNDFLQERASQHQSARRLSAAGTRMEVSEEPTRDSLVQARQMAGDSGVRFPTLRETD